MSDFRRSAGWLADKLAEQDRRLNVLSSRKPGLGNSSIEDGAIDEYTADGTFASSVGKQPDGSHVAFPATGPTPAAPSKPTLKATPGLVEVRWNGKFVGDAVSTLDFKHVGVHVSLTPDVDTTPSSQVATIRGELGDVASIVAGEGMVYVCFVAWTAAGKASAPSEVSAVAVPAPADAAFIQNALDDLDTKYDGVVTEAGQLGGRLDAAETDLTAHEGRLSTNESSLNTLTGTTLPALETDLNAAKATLAPLPALVDANKTAVASAKTRLDTLDSTTLPGLSISLTDARTRLSTAEGTLAPLPAKVAQAQTDLTTAFGQLGTGTVDSRIGAAKTDAIAQATTMTNGIGKNLSSTAAPTTSNTAPNGSVWRRLDASGRVIGVWEQTGAGVAGTWAPRLITSEVVDNLDVGKLSSSSATVDTAVISKLAVQIATVIQLNADRITAGQLTSGQIDTANLAATLATILSLNADRITAGTIATARLDVNALSAAIATIIQLNADRITAGTINTARLNTTEIAAQVATVINLNADRITAGTINTSRLNASAIAAATAAFQTVDVKNLFATSGTMSQAVIDKLWADVVHAYKITTDMLLVSKTANLLTDPDIQDLANWTGGFASTTGGKTGRGSILIPQSTSQSGSYYGIGAGTSKAKDLGIRLVPGSTYRVGAWVRAAVNIPASQVKIYMRIYDEAGAQIAFAADVAGSVPQNLDTIPANTYTFVSGMVKIPEDTTGLYGVLGLYKQATFTTSAVRWSDPVVQEATAGELLVDGTVTAAKLEALLVLASEIIAGNPNGTHAKMGPNGYEVLALQPGGTAPAVVIRMGSDQDDYFGVLNAAGESVASISSTGDMTAKSVSATDDVLIGGTSVADMVDNSGGKIIAWASRGTDGKYLAGTTPHPYLSLQVDNIRAGRAYMVSTSPIGVTADAANSDAMVNLHYQSGADRPAKVTDPIIAAGQSVPAGWSTAKRNPVTINRLVTPSVDGTMALLLSYGVESAGRCKITTGGGRSVLLTVTDMGPRVAETGEIRDGTADAPAGGSTGGETTAPTTSVKNYDRTWPANAIQSYLGSGGKYDYSPSYMYSGNGPVSANGDLMSIAVFPDVKSVINGGTVTGVWVYVYYDFWYYGAGGDAYIGLHGQLGVPATKPAKTYSHAVVNGWPRAAGKWVKMSSSTYAGWASGTHRGFTLGGAGGGLERYGYAHNPQLRITWTK